MPRPVRIDDNRLVPLPVLCKRCCGIGMHYLTCPTLVLPAGYSVLSDSVPDDEAAA